MALLMWSGTSGHVWARKPHYNENAPEAWVWAQIEQGREANLNERCNTPALDPRAENESRWSDGCRQVSAAFLVDVLTKKPRREQVPFFGVNIVGARIVGDIDLQNAKLNRAFSITQSRIENNIYLDAAQTDSILIFGDSRIAGAVSAAQVHGQQSFQLTNSEFKQNVFLDTARFDGFIDISGATFDGKVSLSAAKIDGYLTMDGASIKENLDLDGLRLGDSLFMRSIDQNKAIFRDVHLANSEIKGGIDMTGAAVTGDITANGLQIGSSLYMRSIDQNRATFKGVNLTGAKVTDSVDMSSATFDGDMSLNAVKIDGYVHMESVTFKGNLDAAGLQVGASLSMNSIGQNKASFKAVSLASARVTGSVYMNGATFDGDVSLNAAKVDAYVIVDGAAVKGNLDLGGLQLVGSLSMQSIDQNKASFQSVDLGGAKITGDLIMTGATIDGDVNAGGLQVAGFLFMNSTEQNRGSFKTVNLASAKVTGSIDMSGATFSNVSLNAAKVDAYIGMEGATISGNLDAGGLRMGASLLMRSTDKNKARFRTVDLGGAKITGDVSMTGAAFDGEINANGMQVAGSLFLTSTDRNRIGLRNVDLTGAEIKGDVDMSGADVNGDITAGALQIGRHLYMKSTEQNQASFKGANLVGAKVNGSIDMSGATFSGDVSLNSAKVDGYVHMEAVTSRTYLDAGGLQAGASVYMNSTDYKNKASFKTVNLGGAKITGDVSLNGAAFDGDVLLDNAKIDGYLDMSNAAFAFDGSSEAAPFKELNLVGATVSRDIQMTYAAFDSHVNLNADMLQVGGNMLMQSIFSSSNLITMKFAKIGGSLDLRSAHLHRVDISGAAISGDLRLGRLVRDAPLVPPTTWNEAPNDHSNLNLDNTRITNLVDLQDAWPKDLNLDGFSFVHLGGSEGDTAKTMRDRGGEQWDSWIRRDPNYSPGPYEQLAAAFVAMGDRDAADEIHYLGRVRQHETTQGWWSWFFSSFLRFGAGFGIGNYTFRVVWWVLGITALGAAYLWTSVEAAREQGRIWCIGASLARLLPVIEINKEFTDFFNDPKRERLTAWQSLVFSFIGLFGWLLGAILIAAVSGLTQKP
jgi:uncharacterized protein YjbI with pentapeptide repeats